jgi:hypothetical protein
MFCLPARRTAIISGKGREVSLLSLSSAPIAQSLETALQPVAVYLRKGQAFGLAWALPMECARWNSSSQLKAESLCLELLAEASDISLPPRRLPPLATYRLRTDSGLPRRNSPHPRRGQSGRRSRRPSRPHLPPGDQIDQIQRLARPPGRSRIIDKQLGVGLLASKFMPQREGLCGVPFLAA